MKRRAFWNKEGELLKEKVIGLVTNSNRDLLEAILRRTTNLDMKGSVPEDSQNAEV